LTSASPRPPQAIGSRTKRPRPALRDSQRISDRSSAASEQRASGCRPTQPAVRVSEDGAAPEDRPTPEKMRGCPSKDRVCPPIQGEMKMECTLARAVWPTPLPGGGPRVPFHPHNHRKVESNEDYRRAPNGETWTNRHLAGSQWLDPQNPGDPAQPALRRTAAHPAEPVHPGRRLRPIDRRAAGGSRPRNRARWFDYEHEDDDEEDSPSHELQAANPRARKSYEDSSSC
jgi:hypothetical protein